MVVLVVLLTFLHLYYAWAVGFYLYQQNGGVTTHGKWTGYGGAPYAWTNPVDLPGTLVMLEEERASGLSGADRAGSGVLGIFLVVGANVGQGPATQCKSSSRFDSWRSSGSGESLGRSDFRSD